MEYAKMAKKLNMAIGVALAVTMVTLALASPVNAATTQTDYISLGVIGDHIIQCISNAFVDVSVSSGPSTSVPVPIAGTLGGSPSVCLGGATTDYKSGVSTYTAAVGGSAPAEWGVNIVDDVVPSSVGPVALPVVALARIQATYTWRTHDATNFNANCVVGGSSPATNDVCLAEFGSADSAFRNTNIWGVCGSGKITVDNSLLTPPATNPDGSTTVIDYEAHTEVFTDGVVFFALDCSVSNAAAVTVKNVVYDPAATAANSFICDDSANPITMGAVPPIACVFPFPVNIQPVCVFGAAPATFVPVPGIMGTITESFGSLAATSCTSTTSTDPWGFSDSQDSLQTNLWIFTQNVPLPVDLTIGLG